MKKGLAVREKDRIKNSSIQAAKFTLQLLFKSGIIPTIKVKESSYEKEKNGASRYYRRVTFVLDNDWKVIVIPISHSNCKNWIPYNAVLFIEDERFDLSIYQYEPFLLWVKYDADLLALWP